MSDKINVEMDVQELRGKESASPRRVVLVQVGQNAIAGGEMAIAIDVCVTRWRCSCE